MWSDFQLNNFSMEIGHHSSSSCTRWIIFTLIPFYRNEKQRKKPPKNKNKNKENIIYWFVSHSTRWLDFIIEYVTFMDSLFYLWFCLVFSVVWSILHVDHFYFFLYFCSGIILLNQQIYNTASNNCITWRSYEGDPVMHFTFYFSSLSLQSSHFCYST